ncbi:MAG TPA: hypothetical protein VFX18_05490 [Candidatus Nitrosocosmicus sp.]|nr:hypothetical protein [Candidatus Nitrosocosmicus sp.]
MSDEYVETYDDDAETAQEERQGDPEEAGEENLEGQEVESSEISGQY